MKSGCWMALSLLATPAVMAQDVSLGRAEFTRSALPVGPGGEFVAAADANGDDRPDLLVTRRDDGELVCFPSEADGRFGRPVRTPAGNEPTGIAAADFDGDGRVDAAIANHETDRVTLLLGDGRCGFTESPESPLRVRVRPHVHAVASADFNADGRPDLVVDARESEGLLVLPNRGDGRFDTATQPVRMGGDPYRGMAVADLDGDGRPDLVTPNPRDLGIALGDTSRAFAFDRQRSVSADTPFGVAVGDFDGDGRADLLSGSGQSSAVVEVFLGRANGGFDAHPDSPFQFATGAKSVAVGDFDNDGLSDAVAASYTAGEVLVLMGGRRTMVPVRLSGFENPWGLATADFNGDRCDDLAVVDQGGEALYLYLSDECR